jgi:hypothetical protein
MVLIHPNRTKHTMAIFSLTYFCGKLLHAAALVLASLPAADYDASLIILLGVWFHGKPQLYKPLATRLTCFIF